MYNCLTAELWKAIHNRLFFYSLAIGIGLALADVIQNAEAVQRMTEILIELDQDGIPVAMDHEGFSLFIRWISVNGYTYGNQVFYLIWPILVAIPYGWSYFEDRKEGVYNHLVCQSGRKNYFISKYIATYISGGLAIMLPVLLNLLMNALICPYCVPSVSSSINSIFNGWFLAEIYYTNPWLFALIWCGIIYPCWIN